MPLQHVIKNYLIRGGNSQGAGTVESWISEGKLRNKLVPRYSSPIESLYDQLHSIIISLLIPGKKQEKEEKADTPIFMPDDQGQARSLHAGYFQEKAR